MSKLKVPVGASTIAGYSVTVTSVVLAVLAYVQGDRSEQTLGVITAGAVALVSFAITQIGRYVQARELAKREPLGATLELSVPRVSFEGVTNFAGYNEVVYGERNPRDEEADDDDEPEPHDNIDHDARELRETLEPLPDRGDAGLVLPANAAQVKR